MRIPTHLHPTAETIAKWLASGKRELAREALREASPRVVLDTVYAFVKYTTKTENYVTTPADPTDPQTLLVAFHVIRSMTEMGL